MVFAFTLLLLNPQAIFLVMSMTVIRRASNGLSYLHLVFSNRLCITNYVVTR